MNTATDARRYGFFQIDNEVIDNYDLSPLAGWLYVVIVRHINSQTHTAFPSLRTLAKKANMTRPTVIKYLEELETKKLIAVERNARTGTKERENNHYTVLPVDKVVKEIDHSGKSDLPPVVNDVDHKNTNIKNTESNTCTDTPTSVSSATPKRAVKSRGPRIPAERMNPMKDAIASAFGWQWTGDHAMTPEEKGMVQKTARSLCLANVQPSQVGDLYAYCDKRFDTFTPVALSKHVSTWRKKQPDNGRAPLATDDPSPTALLESAMYGGDS